MGAILVPGQRTMAAALRVMGRSDDGDYARYHKVASVARMRKLLVILNAIVKHRSPWGDMSSTFPTLSS